ncbi:TlpA disulfide reductase family protein [Shewanella acanthi]|uniref:TlpA disulfide reductase family protein n=1 Tax=Shewanella acanthi TaxID=2864212 RepID=UPI001C659F28|nr:TlpA disulfide reductase family protein [Shewanella acanthi]QYJ80295.1 TlpA family protein disulfide reductase [Shewanella acanthi]
MKKSLWFTGLAFAVLSAGLSMAVNAAPSLVHTVQNEHEQTVSLNEFKGKVVYVDFWASWCGPCRKSFPWMNAMQAKYADKGLAIVAINLDPDKKDADDFLQKLPATFNVRFNPEGDVAKSFDLLGMPSSFIFDKQGKLVRSHVGFTPEKSQEYEQELVELLKE